MEAPEFDPYAVAVGHLDEGDAVAAVPIVTPFGRSWAVAHWVPFPTGEPDEVIALYLISAARRALVGRGVEPMG